VDRHAEALAELSSVLSGFAAVADECDRICKQGDADAEEIQRQGRERSVALVSDARHEAAADREAVIARARRDADSLAEKAMREAQERAGRIRRDAASRHGEDVAQVIAAVRAQLRHLLDGSPV
jgi:vacuolar-type H+-ATPase subunit E/Vma4